MSPAWDSSTRHLRPEWPSPGEFPVSIFDVVLNRYTIRGSIVGTRADLNEALAMAAERKIKPTIEVALLKDINKVFARLRQGQVSGRIVLETGGRARSR
jgi:propanol-preferring alcohol dehydrogenase